MTDKLKAKLAISLATISMLFSFAVSAAHIQR